MSESTAVLQELITLSRNLGDPARDLAILGEGNTSARVDDAAFLVKASGSELRTAEARSFVSVSLTRALDVLNGPQLTDSEIRDALAACRTNPADDRMPSIETIFHGYLLSLPGIRFVGHTHPIAVNSVLCSVNAREAVSGRLFPDEIVCCGPAVCYVEYADPGIPLARSIREQVEAFIDRENMPPKVILMENHGLIALGKSARDVEVATYMYVKTARVLVGTYAMGGPRFMTPEHVERIFTRPDELYRKKQLGTL